MPRKLRQGGPKIRDVAREASVGLGTVSRVLNGGKEVRGSTRDRVLATIQRLGFRPNAQARRIHRQHSEIVCFVLSNRDFLNPFHARILQGVEDCARLLRQHVLFAAANYEPGTAPHHIMLPSILSERGLFDGLILAGTNYSNFIRRIQNMQIPFVAFGNNLVDFEGLKHFDQVSYDGKQGEIELVRFIIRQGHKSVAFVGGRTYPWARVRHDAYLQVLSEAGLKPVPLRNRVPRARLNTGNGQAAASWPASPGQRRLSPQMMKWPMACGVHFAARTFASLRISVWQASTTVKRQH